MRIFEKPTVVIIISITQIYFGLAIFKVVPGYQGPPTMIATGVGALLIFLGLMKLYVKFFSKPKTNAIDLKPEDLHEVKRLIREDQEMAAIIYLRDQHNADLKDATKLVEKIKNSELN